MLVTDDSTLFICPFFFRRPKWDMHAFRRWMGRTTTITHAPEFLLHFRYVAAFRNIGDWHTTEVENRLHISHFLTPLPWKKIKNRSSDERNVLVIIQVQPYSMRAERERLNSCSALKLISIPPAPRSVPALRPPATSFSAMFAHRSTRFSARSAPTIRSIISRTNRAIYR